MTARTLIPRKVLFGNPTRAMAKLSPDGRYLSYAAPVEGVLNIWVAPSDDLSAAKPITQERVRNVRFYEWAYTSRHILYMQDANGDENWHVLSTDVESGETRDLTPITGVNAQLSNVSHLFPEEVLIGLNDRNEQLHDLHRVNILTGERALVQENPGFAGMLADESFAVRLAFLPNLDGSLSVQQPNGSGGWREWATIPHEDSQTTSPYAFSTDGNTLYLADSRGRNTSALFAVDMQRDRKSVV